ncbi:MAG: nucleotidyltransferase family protein, partial [Chloroflexota bacterium]|nr:nucleotidyltransferase family protein [Chloroflexota bacterium]
MYAFILAGGKGERLRPLTDTLPKPMVPVCGKPILEHQVEWLKMGGVTDVVFLSGYRADAIEDHFRDGKDFGINAYYSVEDSPLGRGGAIKAGFPNIPSNEDTVAVLNGDVITEEPLDRLTAVHRERKSDNSSHMATIMVVPMVSPYGLVDIDPSDMIIGFREKVEMEHWINAGVYVFDRYIVDELPDLGDHETSTFPRLADVGQLAAVRSRKFWQSVDSFKD